MQQFIEADQKAINAASAAGQTLVLVSNLGQVVALRHYSAGRTFIRDSDRYFYAEDLLAVHIVERTVTPYEGLA